MQMTRGSFRSFQSSCPYPTSIENTRAAPFCSIQSVNPPVDAPISMHVFPASRIGKTRNAFSSFSPPRET